MRRRKKNKNANHVGKKSGLNISAFLDGLFSNNELFSIPATRPEGIAGPITDEVIKTKLAKEFPNSVMVSAIVSDSKRMTIGSLRSMYNYNKRHKPSLISLRWNDQCQPCTKYEAPMSLYEIRERCVRYGIIDPRFFTRLEIYHLASHKEEFDDIILPPDDLCNVFTFGCIDFGKKQGTKRDELDEHFSKLERLLQIR